MRNEKKFLNSNERKADVMLKNKLTLHGNEGLNLIQVIGIIILILLICLVIFLVPNFKNFFPKDVEKNITNENTIHENKNDEIKEYYETLQDGTKVNTSEEIEKYEPVLNGIKFSNIKVTENEGITYLEIDYENTLDTDVEGFGIKLNFYNEKDEVSYYYSVSLAETIKGKEKDKIYTNILEEYAGIKNVKIEIDPEL